MYLRFSGKESNTTFAAAEELIENDVKEKEAEMPVILGLKAKGMKGTQAGNPSKISDEVSRKLIRDQKKNLNDSGGDNSTVRNTLRSYPPFPEKEGESHILESEKPPRLLVWSC